MTQIERFQDTAAALYKYAIVRLRDKQAAEDAVSETLVRFLQNPKSSSISERESKFWLLGILRNIIQEEFRRKNLIVEPQWKENLPDIESQLVDVKGKTMEDVVVDDVLYDQVKTAIRELDQFTQEVITLHIWEDLSFTEIAKLTNQEPDMVRKRFDRGVQKLRNVHSDKSDTKKIHGMALPLILMALKKLASDIEYSAAPEFMSNLFVKFQRMMPQPLSLWHKLVLKINHMWGVMWVKSLVVILGVMGLAAVALVAYNLFVAQQNANTQGTTSSSVAASAVSSRQEVFPGGRTIDTDLLTFEIPADWVINRCGGTMALFVIAGTTDRFLMSQTDPNEPSGSSLNCGNNGYIPGNINFFKSTSGYHAYGSFDIPNEGPKVFRYLSTSYTLTFSERTELTVDGEAAVMLRVENTSDRNNNFRWYEVFVPSKQMSIYTSDRLRDSDAIVLKDQMLQVIQTVEFK